MAEETWRLDAEWISVSAVRELIKMAAKGDSSKATYDNALELGGSLYPELLGPEKSLLRRERESDTAKEYRQRATVMSIKEKRPISPLALIQSEIENMRSLLAIAQQTQGNRTRVDQLKKKLKHLVSAEQELNPTAHSENQLIFRDVYNVDRPFPGVDTGRGYRSFELPDGNYLRIRVLHPDKPEHISGADIIYERHDAKEHINIVAVQYKIWEEKCLRLSGDRIKKQLKRLKSFICDQELCNDTTQAKAYRFPFCAAFLRPTDRLQQADQRYISSGEHLPICRIKECQKINSQGGFSLRYGDLKSIALSGEAFEYLFNNGKIGSRNMTYAELTALYKEYAVASSEDTVVIHAQEFS